MEHKVGDDKSVEDMFDRGEDVSFAEAMETFGRSILIETRISATIRKSRVPWYETRKFLKAEGDAMLQTPVCAFLIESLSKMGVGEFEITNPSIFEYILSCTDAPVSSLYPWAKNKKVCYLVVNAIQRFFTEDLDLACEVEELECKNAGATSCKFRVSLQPFGVYQVMLDELDTKLLNELSYETTLDELKKKFAGAMDTTELKHRLNLIKQYMLVDDKFILTDIGNAYLAYLNNPLRKTEEVFTPPWEAQGRERGRVIDIPPP